MTCTVDCSAHLRASLLLGYLLASLNLGCFVASPDKAVGSEKAQEVWQAHEAVVASAVDGEPYRMEDFEKAVDFFAGVSGIEIRVDMGTLGLLPIPETEKDLARVREWHRENKRRLKYDENTKRVLQIDEQD